jgi:crossover junction endodeoxyribonuclease RusA
MKKITLPLPSRNLSPNARLHWAAKAKHTREAKRLAWVAAWEQVGVMSIKAYRLDFYWATQRRRDKDNAAAMCKAYLDGIAKNFGQDDSEWDFDGVRFHIDRENPRLEIVIFEL